LTDWAETLRLAEKEVTKMREKKEKKKVIASSTKKIGHITGQSSGERVPFNKIAAQKRAQKWFLTNRGGHEATVPTPEQIALRKKRNEREAVIEARKKERRHRGGYKKTKAYKKKNGEENEQS
tara:strand:- start:308 stop:676 length:369 start_codon:yes stop_codon:yes gene_type:complete